MKKILLFAATAMLFAACTNEDVVVPQVAETNTGALAFDVYTAAATRAAVDPGVQTTTTLQGVDKGFGVFATQATDGSAYATYKNGSNVIPNFMYNEHVTYTSNAWAYTPVKYWPNETTKDMHAGAGAAISTYTDRLSFFAYAPYIPAGNDGVIASGDQLKDGDGTTPVGITALTGNDDKGDPTVSYQVATYPSKSVDLLWGVAPTGGLSYKPVNSASNLNVTQYNPLIDLVKPSKDQKMKFLFQHALARLGLSVVAAVDQIAPGGNLAANTKIVIKSITVTDVTATDANAVYMSGKLNLNSGANYIPVGAEAATAKGARANWGTKTDKLNLTIDEAHLLKDELSWEDAGAGVINKAASYAKAGVTTTEKNLFADGQYFMVIPSHADVNFQVVIDYFVLTSDGKLDGNYAVTENVITKDISIAGFTNNKAYNLKLILGMTSVKLDAEVADWLVDGSIDVNLPKNEE